MTVCDDWVWAPVWQPTVIHCHWLTSAIINFELVQILHDGQWYFFLFDHTYVSWWQYVCQWTSIALFDLDLKSTHLADTRYFGQNSDPRQMRFDWEWLPILWTLTIMATKPCPEGVWYKSRVDCIPNKRCYMMLKAIWLSNSKVKPL